jgi:hypothetical protein
MAYRSSSLPKVGFSTRYLNHQRAGSGAEGFFANDIAMNFLASVARKGWDSIDHLLDDEEAEEYLERAEGQETLAAAALIAALLDGRSQSFPLIARQALDVLRSDRGAMREIAAWVSRARAGVERVLSEDSELREQAEATGDEGSFCEAVEELRDRLS